MVSEKIAKWMSARRQVVEMGRTLMRDPALTRREAKELEDVLDGTVDMMEAFITDLISLLSQRTE